MTEIPTPAALAARFGRRPPTPPQRQRPRLLPTGWDDGLPLPMKEHFYLDTGIFHGIACSLKVVGNVLVAVVKGHEENATICNEVRTQRSSTTLRSMAGMLLPLVATVARPSCDLVQDMDEIESIRNELITDAQQRHPDAEKGASARTTHGGEAELIHLAEQHEPHARLVCNDAGASAVGARHGLASMHFLHVLRAAVRAGHISVTTALDAAREGLSESGLDGRERARTECAQWLGG